MVWWQAEELPKKKRFSWREPHRCRWRERRKTKGCPGHDPGDIQEFVQDSTRTRRSTRTIPPPASLDNHESVRHSQLEYVRGSVHTNGVESFWSMMKRAYMGTFHRLSERHLPIRRRVRRTPQYAGTGNAGSDVLVADRALGSGSVTRIWSVKPEGGGFQFHHIRLDRRWLPSLSWHRPSEILFNVWTKGEVSEEQAGRLVRMAAGQSVTFKLTKRPEQMHPIEGWAIGP